MSRWRLRGVAAAILGILAALLASGSVAAHAELASSTPAPNSTLKQAPTILVLGFTEAVDAASPSVELLDETGQPIAGVGPATPAGGDRQLTATLPTLQPGVYEVSYRVTSAVDGHVTAGVFAFRFDPTGTLPPPTTAVTSSSPSADPPTIAARWTLLVLLLVLFGTSLFWLVAARPASVEVAAARSTGGDPSVAGPVPPPWRAMAVIGLAAVAALLAFLSLSAAATGAGDSSRESLPFDPVAPFGWTSFAIAMRITLVGVSAACVIAIARALLAWRTTDKTTAANRESLFLALLLACLLAGVGGLSFAGHAAANGGPVFAAVDTLHLLSVAAWLGTLGGLALLAWRTRRLPIRREVLGNALARHSRVALVAAPAVALTGLANSPIVLGSTRELVASDYGNLVVAKALLFSVAVAIGSANFFLVRRGALRHLAPLLAGEAAMGLLAVVAAATMLSIQPGVGRVPTLTQSTNQAAHVYLTAGSSQIHAAIDIPAPGDQLYEVAVADANGTPRTDVAHVVLDFRPPPRSGLAARRVALSKTVDPTVWAVQGTFTPVLGEWTIGVIVQRTGHLDEAISFPLAIQTPIPPQLVPAPDTGIGVPAPLAFLWLLPDGPAGWGLLAIPLVAAALLWLLDARRRRGRAAGRPPRLLARISRTARLALMGVALVLALGLGSRAVVDAANAPTASLANPIAATADSIERGRLIYLANCSSCHGTHGDGSGPQAPGLLPAPGAIGSVVGRLSDGALYELLTNGVVGTQMPAFATSLSENDRWDLVNELHSRWPPGSTP